MLRVVPHKSAAAALAYYTEGLAREDYYSEGQEIVGQWYGKAAAQLGLAGCVTREAFAALVENRHPATGERLTLRQKAERVVGTDFNFHAPKSLSLVHAITGDERIPAAFRKAVAETMADIEALTETRVRRGNAQNNRFTGNLAWAEFLHLTARPVDGKPCPHLHVHCFVMNATFDGNEGCWKAVKFRNLKANAPYMQAAFHARLSEAIGRLGYGIERTAKDWEISGISKSMIGRFSRRRDQIEALAEKRGITDPKEKDALGALSREGKNHGLSYLELRKEWEGRLTAAELELVRGLGKRNAGITVSREAAAKEAVDYAIEKLFEKNSVVSVNRLVGEACLHGLGRMSPEDAWREFATRKMVVRKLGGEDFCTSVSVLAEEVALINFVRTGRGRYAPLNAAAARNLPRHLSSEKRVAAKHVLQSPDQIIAVRGKAGAGKTTLMKDVVAAIEATGLKVYAFAPSATASRETLREAGFQNAETIAHLLNNPRLQKEIRGNVLWIDEAGLVGIRDMWQILRIAGNDTRILLTGDIGQHSPVARGDPFRLAQQFAGLKIAELTEIWRQESMVYKEAVDALSKGDLRSAFRHLDDLGAILEIQDDAERYKALAEDYVSACRQGSPPLVVSPTHAEGAKVTEAIREARQEAGELRGARQFIRYHDLKWEEADRKRAENFSPGLVVQFHQNAKGVRRGELFHVTGRDGEDNVLVKAETGREIPLPLKDAARFTVFEKRLIEICRGERIQITRNGETADGRRINNGNVFTVKGFTKDGDILLTTGATLDAAHGHFRYGYCETSHSSQSKSVRDVIVAQSADSFIASSREQFYVSVSRGKASIRIYTDDRAGLQQAVGNSSHRRSGVELAGLSAAEISASMENGLNADQWRARVRSRVTDGKSVNFVENVLKQRGMNTLSKPEGSTFREYVNRRRQLAGPDGKNRSKGHPPAKGGKPQSKELGKRSFIRPTTPSGSHKRPEPRQAPSSRIAKATSAIKSSIKNLKTVLSRHAKTLKTKVGKAAKGTLQSVAKQRVKQRTRDKQQISKMKGLIKGKMKQLAKKSPTPGPVIRKK